MGTGLRPSVPLRQALGELREDARQLIGRVQLAAQRLKIASQEGDRAAPPARLDGRTHTLPVHEALQAYQSHHHSLLELQHEEFLAQVRQLGGPLDEFLDTVARALIREDGAASSETVAMADAARDWIRQLYTAEQLQKAAFGFHRAEVCYRGAQLGLELACGSGQIAGAEARGNRLNREGMAALYHLRDHYLERIESVAPLVMARAPVLETDEAREVLGREAVTRTLSGVLNAWRVFDEERYILEQRLDALPLPPFETELEDGLQTLIDHVEFLGSQRQSRERGWHPEEPGRDMHATGISIWLLYTQAASALLYLVIEETGSEQLEPADIVDSLREGLFELMTGWLNQGREMQARLHPQ